MRTFQEPSQALLHYRGPIPPDAPEMPGQRLEGQTQGSEAERGSMQGIKHASPDEGEGLLDKGPSKHSLFCALHKPEFPTRKGVCEE